VQLTDTTGVDQAIAIQIVNPHRGSIGIEFGKIRGFGAELQDAAI